jgi:hypothetical protein
MLSQRRLDGLGESKRGARRLRESRRDPDEYQE